MRDKGKDELGKPLPSGTDAQEIWHDLKGSMDDKGKRVFEEDLDLRYKE